MLSSALKEYRPLIEKLEADTQPPKEVTCPVNGCGKIFCNSSHLTLHKAKVHGVDKDFLKPGSKYDSSCHYHCPILGCYYYKDRHFANYQLLKRHYRGIHGEKKYVCSKCAKSFAMGHAHKRHEATCGVIYHCKTCNCPYTTREAVYMHCMRQQHEPPQDIKDTMKKFKTKNKSSNKVENKMAVHTERESNQPCIIFVSQMNPMSDVTPHQRRLLPKPVINRVIPMTRVKVGHDSISVEKFSVPSKQSTEIQTEIYGVSNVLEQKTRNGNEKQTLKQVVQATTGTQVSLVKPQVVIPSSLDKLSTGMQTNLSVIPKIKGNSSITGTQTSGDHILKSAMAFAEIPIQNVVLKINRAKPRHSRKRSMKTSEVQTKETFPPKKCKRNRDLGHVITNDVGSSIDNTNINPNIDSANAPVLLDFGSSISTQTQKSYLVEYGQHFVQNSQTQTSSIENKIFWKDQESVVIDNILTLDSEKPSAMNQIHNNDDTSNVDDVSNINDTSNINHNINATGKISSTCDHSDNILSQEKSAFENESASFLDLLHDVPLPVTAPQTLLNLPPHTSTMGTQMSPPHTTEIYLPSMAVDFGVQTSSESTSTWSKWNPCLASTAAKDMHTQTMIPCSNDFGVQTSRFQPVSYLSNPSMDASVSMDTDSNAAADMHTQTADDLLDFLITNMETQTDELFIDNFGLSDIETQTPSENIYFDSFVTTETQTNLQSLVNYKDDLTLLTDTETQTQDLTDSHTQTNFDLFSI